MFFIITILLALIMNYFFNLIFHSLTFRYGDRSSMIYLINFVTAFLAGSVFPLAFIEGTAYKILMFLPFKYIFFTPIEIFLGKLTPDKIIASWLYILLWTIAFYVIFKLIYRSGIKHYEAVGR